MEFKTCSKCHGMSTNLTNDGFPICGYCQFVEATKQKEENPIDGFIEEIFPILMVSDTWQISTVKNDIVVTASGTGESVRMGMSEPLYSDIDDYPSEQCCEPVECC